MSRSLWATLLMSLGAASVSAQELPIEQARRDLINRAEQARAEGHHAQALELGTRAGQVRMTPSLRLLIAQEHNTLGHTLEALDQAERCVHEAEADLTLRRREDVLAACSALRDQLTPQIGRLTIRATHLPTGTRIVVGQTELIEALWNTPIPMLPCTVSITAHSVDGVSFARSVDVGRDQSVEVRIDLPSATDAPRPAAPIVPRLVAVPPAPRRPSAGPWIFAGTSLVGAGLAAVFWTLHDSALYERDGACDLRGCDPSAIAADTQARTYTGLTNAALGLSAAAALGAGLWWLIDRQRDEAAVHSRLVFVAPLSGGLLIGAGGSL